MGRGQYSGERAVAGDVLKARSFGGGASGDMSVEFIAGISHVAPARHEWEMNALRGMSETEPKLGSHHCASAEGVTGEIELFHINVVSEVLGPLLLLQTVCAGHDHVRLGREQSPEGMVRLIHLPHAGLELQSPEMRQR
jgi:hypothetical protein